MPLGRSATPKGQTRDGTSRTAEVSLRSRTGAGCPAGLRAAALAEAAGLPLSSHLFPEISAHLLAVAPTSHWLEYVDWANPILEEPLKMEGGYARPPDTPGTGISWDEEAVRRYLVE